MQYTTAKYRSIVTMSDIIAMEITDTVTTNPKGGHRDMRLDFMSSIGIIWYTVARATEYILVKTPLAHILHTNSREVLDLKVLLDTMTTRTIKLKKVT